MNTRKLRKMILTLCSALLLVSMSVGLTVAYLTDTEAVTNTFTVGQVHIKLDEKDTDNDSNTEDNETVEGVVRDKANSYKIMPGHDLEKDPTVTVLADSEECFVRTKVTVNNFADLVDILGIDKTVEGYMNTAAAKIATYALGYSTTTWTANGWVIDETADTVTYEFRLANTVKTDDEDQKFVLFTSIDVPNTLTNDQIAKLVDNPETEAVEPNLQIDVVAHAIQADGFDNADAAWAAFTAAN